MTTDTAAASAGSVAGSPAGSGAAPTDRRGADELLVGIIGCGAIAGNHVEGFRGADGARVIACLDADPERAAAFAQRHGIEQAAATVSQLAELGVQAVAVCTPHPTHEAIVAQAAASGLHVLCEKPIAVDTASARRMVEACEAAGVRLGVLFQRRFWPAAQRLRAAIDDGTVGAPILGQCTVSLHRDPSYYTRDAWRGHWDTDGGGVLMTQAIHYIDLLQWYMGAVSEVYGRWDTFMHGEHIEVEDTAAAVLVFASGAMATLVATTGATPAGGVQIRLTGRTGATVSLSEYPEGSAGTVEVWDVPGQVHHDPALGRGIDPDVDLARINAQLAPYHAAQIQDFVAAVRRGRCPAVTGREALKSLEIIEAVYRCQRTGRPVRLGRSDAHREDDLVPTARAAS